MTLSVDWTFAAFQANQFVEASRRITAESVSERGDILQGHFPSVAIVLGSFAVEAALKALIAGERGFREWSQAEALWKQAKKSGHDLDFLYSQVSAGRRRLVRAKVESPSALKQWMRYDYGPEVFQFTCMVRSGFLDEIGFDQLLSDHSKAFVEWRYVFQALPGYAIPEFLCDLAEAILEVLEEASKS